MPSFSAETATLREYGDLRDASGLGSVFDEKARIGLANTLRAVWLRNEGHVIEMARIIGDGDCFSPVTDVAILPQFKRQGPGARVIKQLLHQAREKLPKDLCLSLIADPGAENLHAKFGFQTQHGMTRTLP